MMSSLGLLWLILAVGLCVHAVRTGQPPWWLIVILLLPGLGSLVYLIIVVLPGLGANAAARRMSQGARETLDPTREHREATAAFAEMPTVHNQMRLAKAAAELGRHQEAERLYAEAATGVHADDPALLLGRAQSLIEMDRPQEALDWLDAIPADAEGHAPVVQLARARALEGVGRRPEAEAAYQDAVGRFPGLEAVARHTAFLARCGRLPEARELLAEINRRVHGANAAFRKEGRGWRDLAAKAVREAAG